MGYTIPPPDYTLPPMQINVGQEIGKTFGAALAQYGRMKRQERKDAERYNRQIAEARMLRDKDKDNQQSQQGGGGEAHRG